MMMRQLMNLIPHSIVLCSLLGSVSANYLRPHHSSSIIDNNNARIRNITCNGVNPTDLDCQEFYLSSLGLSSHRVTLEDGQDRVSKLDHNGIDCMAGGTDDDKGDISIEFINFFYAVETDIGAMKGFIQTIERKLFYAISADLLWCYKKNDPTIDIGKRHLVNTELEEVHNHPLFPKFSSRRRSLTSEEARRLALISVNTAPEDKEVVGLSCNYDFQDEQCEVFQGSMSVVANGNDWVGHMRASLLDAVQDSMDKDILLGNDIKHVSKVKWLGTTMEDAINGGPVGGSIGGAGSSTGDEGTLDTGSTEDVNGESKVAPNDGDFTLRTVFAVSIPLLLLMFLGFLLAKKKGRENRQALTVGQAQALASKSGNYKVYGTGDPPRSFHEGLYHYTRGGARYLSTCCPHCIETRRNGYFLDDILEDNLATITEGERYPPSYDDISMETEGSDSTNGIRLVSPNSKDLGARHCGIDVHNCSSATCAICKRRAENVAFIASPTAAQRARSFPTSPIARAYFPDAISDDSSDTRSLS